MHWPFRFEIGPFLSQQIVLSLFLHAVCWAM